MAVSKKTKCILEFIVAIFVLTSSTITGLPLVDDSTNQIIDNSMILGVTTPAKITESATPSGDRVISEPIVINNDGELGAAATANGWKGDGSKDYPYLIENLEIDAIGRTAAIHIGNVSSYLVIRNCWLHDTSPISQGSRGIWLLNSENCIIDSNTCLYSVRTGIYLSHAANNTIANNNVSTEYGITFESSDHNTLSNNFVAGRFDAIILSSSSFNTLSNNSCSGRDGLSLFFSDYNIILNNNFNGSAYHDALLDSSDYNIIRANSLNNSQKGVILDNSTHNTISDNDIHDNIVYGIHLITGSNNEITDNRVIGNEMYGIWLDSATNSNNIEGNTLIDNNMANSIPPPSFVQAYDDGANYWNSTTGGNYWGDWTAPDINGDGIVDSPYHIDGAAGAMDHLPIAKDVSSDYIFTVSDGKATITGYIGKEGVIKIPETLGGYSVVAIGNNAFMSHTSLISVTIPDTIMSIGNDSFYECASLTSVILSDSVKTIGDFSFAYCTALSSIIIPIDVTSIGSTPFYECTSMTAINVNKDNQNYASVDGVLYNKLLISLIQCPQGKVGAITIPDGVTSIAYSSFYHCIYLTSISMPDSLTSIEMSAFYRCSSLTSIVIPDNLKTIGNQAFYECNNLTSVVIGTGVNSIGELAFAFCSSLSSLTILSNVRIIGDYAFEVCTSLASITFLGLAAPTSIGENWILGTGLGIRGHAYAASNFPAPGSDFYGLVMGEYTDAPSDYTFTVNDGRSTITGYTGAGGAITIPSTLGNYPVVAIGDNAFNSVHGHLVASVIMPSSLLSIGDQAFYQCESLTSVTIVTGVTSIGNTAFELCTLLTSITIPASVTYIGSVAFSYCTALTSITFQGLVAPTVGNQNWIQGTPTTIRGHAYSNSNFPASGDIFYGLMMGTTIDPSNSPSEPINFNAVPTPNQAEIVLSWDVPIASGSSSIQGYNIYWSTTSNNQNADYYYTVTAGLTYHDNSLTTGTTYYYKIKAFNSFGEGPYSSEVSATAGGPNNVAPSIIQNLRATVSNNQIFLTWDTPSSGSSIILGYKIYRGFSSGGEGNTPYATFNVNSYTDSNVVSGQTYYYQVSAYNSQLEGLKSSETLAKVDANVPIGVALDRVVINGLNYEINCMVQNHNDANAIIDKYNAKDPTFLAYLLPGSLKVSTSGREVLEGLTIGNVLYEMSIKFSNSKQGMVPRGLLEVVQEDTHTFIIDSQLMETLGSISLNDEYLDSLKRGFPSDVDPYFILGQLLMQALMEQEPTVDQTHLVLGGAMALVEVASLCSDIGTGAPAFDVNTLPSKSKELMSGIKYQNSGNQYGKWTDIFIPLNDGSGGFIKLRYDRINNNFIQKTISSFGESVILDVGKAYNTELKKMHSDRLMNEIDSAMAYYGKDILSGSVSLEELTQYVWLSALNKMRVFLEVAGPTLKDAGLNLAISQTISGLELKVNGDTEQQDHSVFIKELTTAVVNAGVNAGVNGLADLIVSKVVNWVFLGDGLFGLVGKQLLGATLAVHGMVTYAFGTVMYAATAPIKFIQAVSKVMALEEVKEQLLKAQTLSAWVMNKLSSLSRLCAEATGIPSFYCNPFAAFVLDIEAQAYFCAAMSYETYMWGAAMKLPQFEGSKSPSEMASKLREYGRERLALARNIDSTQFNVFNKLIMKLDPSIRKWQVAPPAIPILKSDKLELMVGEIRMGLLGDNTWQVWMDIYRFQVGNEIFVVIDPYEWQAQGGLPGRRAHEIYDTFPMSYWEIDITGFSGQSILHRSKATIDQNVNQLYGDPLYIKLSSLPRDFQVKIFRSTNPTTGDYKIVQATGSIASTSDANASDTTPVFLGVMAIAALSVVAVVLIYKRRRNK